MSLAFSENGSTSQISLEDAKRFTDSNKPEDFFTNIYGVFKTIYFRYMVLERTVQRSLFQTRATVLEVSRLLLRIAKCLDSLKLTHSLVGMPSVESSVDAASTAFGSKRVVNRFEVWVYAESEKQDSFEHIRHCLSGVKVGKDCDICLEKKSSRKIAELELLVSLLRSFKLTNSGSLNNSSSMNSQLVSSLSSTTTWRSVEEAAWYHYQRGFYMRIIRNCRSQGFYTIREEAIKFQRLPKLEAHVFKMRFLLRNDSVTVSFASEKVMPPFWVPVEICFPVLQRRQKVLIEPFGLTAEVVGLTLFRLDSTPDVSIWRHPKLRELLVDSERLLVESSEDSRNLAFWVQFPPSLTGLADKDANGLLAVPMHLCFAYLNFEQFTELQQRTNLDNLPLSASFLSRAPMFCAPYLKPLLAYHMSSNNANVSVNRGILERFFDPVDLKSLTQAAKPAKSAKQHKRTSATAFSNDERFLLSATSQPNSLASVSTSSELESEVPVPTLANVDDIDEGTMSAKGLVFLSYKNFYTLCLAPPERPLPTFLPKKIVTSKSDVRASLSLEVSFSSHLFSHVGASGTTFYTAVTSEKKELAKDPTRVPKCLYAAIKSRRMDIKLLEKATNLAHKLKSKRPDLCLTVSKANSFTGRNGVTYDVKSVTEVERVQSLSPPSLNLEPAPPCEHTTKADGAITIEDQCFTEEPVETPSKHGSGLERAESLIFIKNGSGNRFGALDNFGNALHARISVLQQKIEAMARSDNHFGSRGYDTANSERDEPIEPIGNPLPEDSFLENERTSIFLNLLQIALLRKQGIVLENCPNVGLHGSVENVGSESIVQMKPHGKLLTLSTLLQIVEPGSSDSSLLGLVLELLCGTLNLYNYKYFCYGKSESFWMKNDCLTPLSQPLDVYTTSNFLSLLAMGRESHEDDYFKDAFGPLTGSQAGLYFCSSGSIAESNEKVTPLADLFPRLNALHNEKQARLSSRHLVRPLICSSEPPFLVKRVSSAYPTSLEDVSVSREDLLLWASPQGQAANRFVPWSGPLNLRLLGIVHNNFGPSNVSQLEDGALEQLQHLAAVYSYFGFGSCSVNDSPDFSASENASVAESVLPSIVSISLQESLSSGLSSGAIFFSGGQLLESVLCVQQHLSKFTKSIITTLFDSPDGGKTLQPTNKHVLILFFEPQKQEISPSTLKLLEMVKYTALALFLRHLATELDMANGLGWLTKRVVLRTMPLTRKLLRLDFAYQVVSDLYSVCYKDRYDAFGGIDPLVYNVSLSQRRHWSPVSFSLPMVVLNPRIVYRITSSVALQSELEQEKVLHVQYHFDVPPLYPDEGSSQCQVGSASVPSVWKSTAVLTVVWCDASGEYLKHQNFLAHQSVSASKINIEGLCLWRRNPLNGSSPLNGSTHSPECQCLGKAGVLWTRKQLLPLVTKLWIQTLDILSNLDGNWRLTFGSMCKHTSTISKLIIAFCKSSFDLLFALKANSAEDVVFERIPQLCAIERILSVSLIRSGFMSGAKIFTTKEPADHLNTSSSGVARHYTLCVKSAFQDDGCKSLRVSSDTVVLSAVCGELLNVSLEQLAVLGTQGHIDGAYTLPLKSGKLPISVRFLARLHSTLLRSSLEDNPNQGENGVCSCFEKCDTISDELELRPSCRMLLFAYHESNDDNVSIPFAIDLLYHLVNPSSAFRQSHFQHWNPKELLNSTSPFFDAAPEIPKTAILNDIVHQYHFLGHLGALRCGLDPKMYLRYTQQLVVHYLDQARRQLEKPRNENVVGFQLGANGESIIKYQFENLHSKETHCMSELKGLLLPYHFYVLGSLVRILRIILSGSNKANSCPYAALNSFGAAENFPYSIPVGQYCSFDPFPDCLDKCECN